MLTCCFRYHKGTDFQANHNSFFASVYSRPVVLDTTKVQIFKQITTLPMVSFTTSSCFRYHKGTDFQANHNASKPSQQPLLVVLDTTKVQIFKQITTTDAVNKVIHRCFRYHKGTDFQANHNFITKLTKDVLVVLDTTKVQIFKQITTHRGLEHDHEKLF